jgi:uncharacterized protein (TIGR01244 family)
MSHTRILTTSMLLILAVLAFPVLASEPIIDGFVQPEPERLVGGQPEPHELVAARDAGFMHVFNARGIGELDGWDEVALVKALGMTYHPLPIAQAGDLNRESVAEFDRILQEIGDQPAVMHCASGNRVGALYALHAAWYKDADTEQAVEIGRAHGLAGLESQVRSLLDEAPTP